MQIDCDNINQPALLVSYFLWDDESRKISVFNCFHNLYMEEFTRIAFGLCSYYPTAKYNVEQFALEAFTEGLLSFYFSIRQNGFTDGGATVKGLFLTFCKYKLKGLLTDSARRSGKYYKGDPGIILGKMSDELKDDYISFNNEQKKDEMDLLTKAMGKLNERCRNLIIWRKLGKMSNEEIASRLGIEPRSVNNEVYKCFERLKKIADELKERD